MRSIPLATLVLIATAPSTLRAQEASVPTAIRSMDVVLGHWEGSGTMTAGPSAPAASWQATMSFKRILGGHYIQQDARVRFDGQAEPLVIRRIVAFDRDARRLRVFRADNSGLGESGDAYWCEGHELRSMSSRIEQGRLIQDDTTYDFEGESCTVRVRRKGNGDGWFDHVAGSLKRMSTSLAGAADAAVRPLNPPCPQMKRMSDFLGSWSFTGHFVPMSGEGKTPISGTCEVSSLLGGHAVHALYVTRDLPGLDSNMRTEVYVSWDPVANCFRRLVLSDDGNLLREAGYRYENGDLVYTSSQVIDGQPVVRRTLFQIEDGGNRLVAATDRAVGTGAVQQSPVITLVKTSKNRGR